MSACSNRRQGGLSNSNGVPCRRIPAKRAPEKARPNPRDAERPNAEWKLGRSSEFWLTGRIPEIRFGSPWGRSPSTRLLPDDPVHPDFTGHGDACGRISESAAADVNKAHPHFHAHGHSSPNRTRNAHGRTAAWEPTDGRFFSFGCSVAWRSDAPALRRGPKPSPDSMRFGSQPSCPLSLTPDARP